MNESEPPWVRRFRAPTIGFPRTACDAEHLRVYYSNADGVGEIHSWNRETDRHIRLTDRPHGTATGAVTPDGGAVWWFDDTDGDEFGRWMRQPFGVPASEATPVEALPGLEPGWQRGHVLGRSVAGVGLSRRDGVRLYLHRYADQTTSTLQHSPTDATMCALSEDETLVAIQHTDGYGEADGDAGADEARPAMRVLRVDGTCVLDLWDGPGRGLWVREFAPVPGDRRLLVQHERRERRELLICDTGTGAVTELPIDVPGDLDGAWYPDGDALLVRARRHGRSRLYRYPLATGEPAELEIPDGSIRAFEVRRDGTPEYLWCSDERALTVLAGTGSVVLEASPAAPPSVPLTDHWIDGPAGPIHTLVTTARATDRPAATVFWMTGGPGGRIEHEFIALRAMFVDAGYRVIHANYRGSDGYGARWRDANREAPGLVELEDLAAVRAWAVERGLADPDRCVVSGVSWGGYLTLLALGSQPDLWAAGVGLVPIGDLVALYEDEMAPVQDGDRALFGGTPEELPDKWARSNPLTYVDHVTAPLFVTGGENDPRCPMRQIEKFLAQMDDRSAAYELHRFDAGHGIAVVDEAIVQARKQLDFLTAHVSPN